MALAADYRFVRVDPLVLQIGADIDIDIDFRLPPPPADQTLDPNPGARGILQFLMETNVGAGGVFGLSATLSVTLNGQPVMNEPNLRDRDRRPYYSHIGPGLFRGGQGNIIRCASPSPAPKGLP